MTRLSHNRRSPNNPRGPGRRGGGYRASAAPAWTPASLTALRGWYRGDDVTLNGSDVTSFNDKTGTGNHLTDGGTASRRPAYSATGGPNSTPILSFDGVGEYLSDTAFSWGAAVGAHSIAIVAKVSSFVASERWIEYGGLIVVRSGGTNIVQGLRIAGTTSSGTTNLGTAAFHTIIYTWTGASQSLYVDGVAEDTDANASAAVADGGAFSLGAAAAGSVAAAIDVAEVVVQRAAMTAGELASFDAYVATRYGI